jgi:hypothetical protein
MRDDVLQRGFAAVFGTTCVRDAILAFATARHSIALARQPAQALRECAIRYRLLAGNVPDSTFELFSTID